MITDSQTDSPAAWPRHGDGDEEDDGDDDDEVEEDEVEDDEEDEEEERLTDRAQVQSPGLNEVS